MMENDFWVLDFEASGLNLSVSYPIEVGYFNGTIEKVFLIKPADCWWHWDEEAEKVHGITQGELVNNGLNPCYVADQMTKDLAGKIVIVDGWQYDLHWLWTLYDYVGTKPGFALEQSPIRVMKPNCKHRALSDAKDIWYELDRYQRRKG